MLVCFIKCVFGPELFRLYKQGVEQGRDYQPSGLEYFSNTLISFFRGFYVFCKWTSPVILALAYYRGYFSYDGIYAVWRIGYLIAIFLASSYLARGCARYSNRDYQMFIKKFVHLNKNPTEYTLRRKFLLEHDFEMKYWKCDYEAKSLPPKFNNHQHRLFHDSIIDSIKYFFWRFLSKFCVDTFGLKMTYPGVVVQSLIGKILLENRTKFIEQKRAQRALIQTADTHKNKIDTLFVDQRNKITKQQSSVNSFHSESFSSESNGNYLVVCCDGNASFYEVGIFQIPIENGYSCLGWNYPGFGQSTGEPYPTQVTAAADAVMQYAHSLGFKTENIVLFSWSIGGFATSWLATHYPNVKAVVLDACFDHIIPLAIQRMPSFASQFVDYAIRHNLNLNVAQQIENYNGPLTFIRRTFDEIISTTPRVAASNRGNDLLLNTLKKRYPYLIDDYTLPYLRTWLSAKTDVDRTRILNSYSNDIQECENKLVNYIKKNTTEYPIELGKPDGDSDEISKDLKLTLALYLANKYLVNYESAHCNPLPKEYFALPWTESDLLRYRF